MVKGFRQTPVAEQPFKRRCRGTHCSRASEQQVTASEQQVKASKQQSTDSEKQVTAGEEQVTADEEHVTTSEELPVTSEQHVAASEQEATASDQEATASEKQPTESKQKNAAYSSSAAIDHGVPEITEKPKSTFNVCFVTSEVSRAGFLHAGCFKTNFLKYPRR